VNLEVQAVSEPHPTPPNPPFGGRDLVAMAAVILTSAASWVYLFIHPSDTNFGICVGGCGAVYAAYHWICIKDSKVPDA
jgi:hypothetical protein